MKLGTLDFTDVRQHLDLVAEPVRHMLERHQLRDVYVAEIDPSLADTAAFCEQYGVGMDVSANCVVLEAKRAERVWYVACMVLATERADVNGIIRRHLDARKISFASMDTAVQLTGMEYGGITPVGLPGDWPILVDEVAARTDRVIIGSGVRRSKLLVPGKLLANLPGAEVLALAKTQAI